MTQRSNDPWNLRASATMKREVDTRVEMILIGVNEADIKPGSLRCANPRVHGK